MIAIPILALLIGLAIGYYLNIRLDALSSKYLAVACLAGLDSVLGGVRASYESKFQNDVFVTGFFANILISFFVAWLGDQLYLDLYIVVALIMGGRIFQNLSLIRRYILQQFNDWRSKRKARQELNAESATARGGIEL